MGVEADSYSWLLRSHFDKIASRSNEMSEEQWLWRPTTPAPSARETVEHAWAWLISDRLHIENEVDMKTWRTPDPPQAKAAMVDEFEAEAARWSAMLDSMNDSTLDETRNRFGLQPATIRFLIQHMVQNVIYKSGQLSTLYFAQGLDGTEPFAAPLPNEIVDMIASGEIG